VSERDRDPEAEQDDAGSDPSTSLEVEGDDPVPSQLRLAAMVIGIEALALVAAAGVLISKTITGHPDNPWRAFFGAALAVIAGASLALAARSLVRLSSAARTPVVVLQLLALPVGYSLAFQAGLVVYGGPILLAALAVLYLLFSPPARLALDRAPR
jgi:hypothetical protein